MITYQRSRITGAGLVAAQYDLTLERQTKMENILFIPGIANPVSEINNLLFGQGQQGGFWAPSLTPSLISGSTFGTGVETLPDLSPRNNPFSQSTPSSRAAWFREPKTGRRNLLLQTESYTGWTQQPRNAVFGINDPFGGTLAVTVKSDDVNQTVYRPLNYAAQGASVCVNSVYIRRRLGSGTITMVAPNGAGVNITSSVGSSWARITTGPSTTASSGASSGTFIIQLATLGDEIDLAFPQAETGSTPTAYQRVTTAFDVTEAGQRDCYGLRTDGTDDGYQTGSIDFSNTPRVTVFAAVRKLSDAADGCVVELGTGGQEGTFSLLAPGSTTAARFQYNSRGVNFAIPFTSSSAWNAPVTAIATGITDIENDISILRLNGTQIASVTTDQGNRNLRNDVLNLFRRNAFSLPFNGNLYALIVAGGSYPLSTIQRVERILSRITPTVNL